MRLVFVDGRASCVSDARARRCAERRRREARIASGARRPWRSNATVRATGDDYQESTSSRIAPVSPRRVAVGVVGSTALALGANFLRVTEKLLSLAPDWSRRRRLDVVYPVVGYTRCYKPNKGYEFIVPVDYLVDQTMVRRNMTRGVVGLDPPSLEASKLRTDVNEPDSAYGPVGSTGEENVSVITSAVPRGFDLAVFGDAEAQAGWLLDNVLARPGSGKTGKLLSASQRKGANGTTYYTFEYTIQTETWFRHNIAVFATRGATLYTFVAQIPETRWPSMRDAFFVMADSFRVFVPS
ncbi:Mog1/PsbP, alpha/beta/alpha sandwich [Ostreococcus tauri]|uniref:Mog1/PsbP, alpha/beta/alpha sandwich n=1 Tax=Ostreococcus tauri TaxID=70448 RepID=A0A096PA40_OSTTA|nr:Mog1/PsbP, alpha/beta/alpha sandwich [Ostreococcus tauri]CEG01256.1 Mog1/PsbP, alpha/beta/alpha sandwich [Ostreococcus tauri]|eukprot:XP_003080065.1 Mog1/PsbP, alpha/beta/alpha sandwich [Ostreococcus tauri]